MDNISLTLKKGNIAGLIGNNGAGKTTLMKLISGILERPNGTIDLNTKTVGTLIEAPALYPNMTVEANLKFYCRLYHKDYSSIDCYKEDLEVATYLKRKASKLSLGMKQRVGLFIALITSDEFILLDEPTNNLDIYHATNLMKIIRKLSDELGKTVVTVLHEINYAAFYSDYICAFKDGRVAKFGTVDEVMTKEVLSEIYNVDFEIMNIQGRPLSIYY